MPLPAIKTPRILAALVAAAALGAPATAHAATPGVNLDGAPTASSVQEALATGAKTVRIFALWRDFEPNRRGEYPSADHNLANTVKIFDDAIRSLNAAGAKPLFVVTEAPSWANGSGDPLVPPANPADFADFLNRFAAHNKLVGNVAGYEVWNEPDESGYWHPAPDAARYAAMLKAGYAGLKQGDPTAPVATGPTTGNNYEWLDKLYDLGAGGSFDAVSVHTDTACLVSGPEVFYREGLNVARYTFLGYNSVHDMMAAHGDGAKPVWMSELGWSSTNGGPTSCDRGVWAGQKASGVSEPAQAQHLTKAYACLANDPWVTEAAWFTLHDLATTTTELNHYGLLRRDGTPKPSWAAFRAVAAANGGAPAPCADFDGPSVRIVSPTPNTQFVDRIDVQTIASDTGVGLASLKFNYDGGKKIRGFGDPVNDRQVGISPWYGSVDLPPGKHTIEVVAIDKNGNTSTATVEVQKVRKLASTLKSAVKLRTAKVKKKGGAFRVSGEVVPDAGQPLGASIGGKVQIQWQSFQKGKWKTVVKARKTARKPFAFKAKLHRKGRWRVNVTFQGAAPWKKSRSAWLTFKV